MIKIHDSRLIKKLENELLAIRGFEINVENHMKALSESTDDDAVMVLAKAIAFNKRMIQFSLARAEAMLELTGFEIDDGGLTVEELEHLTIRLGDVADD